jgi:adenosylhomocysteine nucleosidase
VNLAAELRDRHDQIVNGIDFATGTIESRRVLLFLSGISMVNASLSTQMAPDRFAVTRIVFSDIAGGADPEFAIGDVVVPAQWRGSIWRVPMHARPAPATRCHHFSPSRTCPASA